MSDILLDTCACLWIVDNAPLASAAVEALDEAFDKGRPTYVSPITAWEVGMLAARGRIALTMPPLAWFLALQKIPGIVVAPLEPEPLVNASFLPGEPPRDPADRILCATARAHNWRLMTRDGLLLRYGEQGNLRLIPC